MVGATGKSHRAAKMGGPILGRVMHWFKRLTHRLLPSPKTRLVVSTVIVTSIVTSTVTFWAPRLYEYWTEKYSLLNDLKPDMFSYSGEAPNSIPPGAKTIVKSIFLLAAVFVEDPYREGKNVDLTVQAPDSSCSLEKLEPETDPPGQAAFMGLTDSKVDLRRDTRKWNIRYFARGDILILRYVTWCTSYLPEASLSISISTEHASPKQLFRPPSQFSFGAEHPPLKSSAPTRNPRVQLSLSNLTFAAQSVGSFSRSKALRLINAGVQPLTIKTIIVGGPSSSDFLQTNDCGERLAAGAGCTVTLKFKPTAIGARDAALIFVDDAEDSPQVVSLSGKGSALVTGATPSAYQLLNDRVTANQTAFYVYQDADSGFNHGFPSGLFGSIDPKTISINTRCVDDATSSTGCASDGTRLDSTRRTVFSIAFPALSSDDFAGLNFEEPEDWEASGMPPSKGYDLTPASAVQFDARSPNGAVVQFGIGGCVTDFVKLSPTWTTMRIPIDLLFSPPDSTVSCPPDITNMHRLFSVRANGVESSDGVTVLLDKIQFIPTPGRSSQGQETLSLPLSTQTFGVEAQTSPIPPDQLNRNAATIYESALTVLALLHRGQVANGDVKNALEIADAFDYALYHDNHEKFISVTPGASNGCFAGNPATQCGLHSGYESGDIALFNDQNRQPGAGMAGDVRLAGFNCNSSFPTGYCLNLDRATGGDNAWAIMALLAAYQQSGNVKYLNDAIVIGNWIVANLLDQTGTDNGGYYVGYPDQGVPSPKPLTLGKSVESNADIFAAFSLLAQIETGLGNTTVATEWTNRANFAGDYVMSMFDSANGRFYAGSLNGSLAGKRAAGVGQDASHQPRNDVINTFEVLRSNLFATLAMAGSQRYGNQLDWSLPLQYVMNVTLPNNFALSVGAGAQTLYGFDLVPAPLSTGVAWEFTGQIAETCDYLYGSLNMTTFEACAQRRIGQVSEAQDSVRFGDVTGMVTRTPSGDTLSSADWCLNTPFQCIPERIGLAATNWAIFADQGVNPLALASVTLSPSALNFPDELVGTSSTAATVTLTNEGTAPLGITSIAIEGIDGNDFALTNRCGATVAVGAGCSINVTFTPAAVGTRRGSITIIDSAINGPHMIALSGTGTAPSVSRTGSADSTPTSVRQALSKANSDSANRIVNWRRRRAVVNE